MQQRRPSQPSFPSLPISARRTQRHRPTLGHASPPRRHGRHRRDAVRDGGRVGPQILLQSSASASDLASSDPGPPRRSALIRVTRRRPCVPLTLRLTSALAVASSSDKPALQTEDVVVVLHVDVASPEPAPSRGSAPIRHPHPRTRVRARRPHRYPPSRASRRRRVARVVGCRRHDAPYAGECEQRRDAGDGSPAA